MYVLLTALWQRTYKNITHFEKKFKVRSILDHYATERTLNFFYNVRLEFTSTLLLTHFEKKSIYKVKLLAYLNVHLWFFLKLRVIKLSLLKTDN